MTDAQSIAVQAVELLPCPNPWCHRSGALKPELFWVAGEAAFECTSCGMRGPSFSPKVYDEDGEQVGTQDAKALAFSAWNTRAPSDQEKLGGELVEALESAADEIQNLRWLANCHGGMIDEEDPAEFRALITRARTQAKGAAS